LLAKSFASLRAKPRKGLGGKECVTVARNANGGTCSCQKTCKTWRRKEVGWFYAKQVYEQGMAILVEEVPLQSLNKERRCM